MTTPTRLTLPRYDQRFGKGRRRPVWDVLHANARPGHWSARHRATRRVIADVVTLARAAGLDAGPVGHVVVELVWAPERRLRADPDNLWPLLKAAADALARGRSDLPGLHLVPDDDGEHMTKLAPVIAMPPPKATRRKDAEPPPAGLWLNVYALNTRPTRVELAALLDAAESASCASISAPTSVKMPGSDTTAPEADRP